MNVVGIGASAGGLDAIERLFDKMPAETGMAFVVVQHLSPNFRSLMDELLARHTKMPIHRVEDGMQLEPNGIYLIPPKKNMALERGTLRLTDQDPSESPNLPIDFFFSSLAEDVGNRAIAIVLSGTGSDGSRGLRDIHNRGGLVIVQDVESASFDGMPRSAAATQMADVVCAPEEMATHVVNYGEAPVDFLRGQYALPAGLNKEGEKYEIFRLFRHKYGIDFSLYKPATIDRRIERRIQMTKSNSMSKYIKLLEADKDELDHLYRDLLVEVTHCFRDPDAFRVIRDEVAPRLIANAPEGSEVRVWTPGCATGEEAYSLAMIFHDCAQKRKKDGVTVKIFATDVHQRSLEIASAGVYQAEAVENVPADLRAKYLSPTGDLYHVTKELRQCTIFAPNDLTSDPPFTKIDLVSCRNVLIYLEPQVQKKIISLFHFGLKTGGVLFLGPSETLGELANEFEPIDRQWRIYSKQRDVRLPLAPRMPVSPAISRVVQGRSPFVAKSPGAGVASPVLNQMMEGLLSRYVPPSLLVNQYHELIHSFGNARELLVQPEGRPTLDVLRMVKGELRMAMSAALHKAKQTQETVVYKGVKIKGEGADEEEGLQYKVVVEPHGARSDALFLITLEKVSRPPAPAAEATQFDVSEQSSERISVLEQELTYTRETLQSTVEELETSNEELQSTNEELIASNEELQSTNEELHSVNEELYTVNAEHKQKIEELTQLTSDMDNLLKSTEIGTVFLDRELRIRMFTPSIVAAFSVMEQDIGRPIEHIAYKLNHPDLMGAIRGVIENEESVEREVISAEGKVYLQRIRPYRDSVGVIDGVALTVTDVSAVKEVERAKEHNVALAQANHDLQDFAYAVSHDLQAPLRHIGGACDSLATHVDNKAWEDAKGDIKAVEKFASRLTKMIQNLLTYSRVGTRGKPFEEIDTNQLVKEVVEGLSSSVEQSNAEITVADLPEIFGDDRQLKQVFRALIDNAIKYADEQPPQIKIGCKRLEEDWQFSIRDNGVGIESRHFDRVFVIFQRLGFKPEIAGEGVGLTLSKRIVERHGGKIWIESVPGDGTSVCFTIPAKASIEANAETSS